MRTGSLAMRMAVFFCSIIKLLRISTKTLYCSSTTPVAQMLLIRCILGVRSLRSMFFNVWHEIKYAHLTNTYKALIFNTIHTTSFLATQNCSIKKSWNNLSIQKKFVLLHRFRGKPWAFSSAGSEHLPYKQRVGGSNPSTPTQVLTQGYSSSQSTANKSSGV